MTSKSDYNQKGFLFLFSFIVSVSVFVLSHGFLSSKWYCMLRPQNKSDWTEGGETNVLPAACFLFASLLSLIVVPDKI